MTELNEQRVSEYYNKTKIGCKKQKLKKSVIKPGGDEEKPCEYDKEALRALKSFFYETRNCWKYQKRKFGGQGGEFRKLFKSENIQVPTNFWTCSLCTQKYTFWDEHTCC